MFIWQTCASWILEGNLALRKKKTLEHCVQDWNQGSSFPHVLFSRQFFSRFFFFFSPVEPRMVLVGRGEMILGDPKSKGIHTHLPDRNYSIHVHFSLTSGRIWSGLQMSPQSLQKSWQREITVETQEGVSWHSSQGSHWRFLPLQPIFLWASGSPGRKGKCCIWTVEGPRVRHWHRRTRPDTTPSSPGLTLWRITEVGFEWILPFLAEMCSVRGSRSYIFQSYCIMPSFWISSFNQALFLILLGDT